MKNKRYCSRCSSPIVEKDNLCPNCGSANKIFEVESSGGILVLFSSRLRVKNPNKPGYAVDSRTEYKTSGASKNLAEDILVIDRRDPNKTVKKHIVKERKNSKWDVVHHEVVESEAKRR